MGGPFTASMHFLRRILARGLVTTLLDTRAWRKSRCTSSADAMMAVINEETNIITRRDLAAGRVVSIA